MRFVFILLLSYSSSLLAQDYLQEEDMLYEDQSYVEESPSFARERGPAGYDDYSMEDEGLYRQEQEYDPEPVFEESEDAYYAEEELLSP
jgi:hypothetical protein